LELENLDRIGHTVLIVFIFFRNLTLATS